MTASRIARRFEALRAARRPAFVPYLMAGDPDLALSRAVLKGLPAAGADVIEVGAPFTDPMADGPTIQLAGQRALAAGMTTEKTLRLIQDFRAQDAETPIVMMGYYNPIYSWGVEDFLTAAREAGVDGLIVVDLPPEEDAELCLPARAAGLDFIRLATPTTDAARLPAVVRNTSGFVYYVSITGITGAASAQADQVGPRVAEIRAASGLPVCVGFGVKSPDNAREIAGVADGVVVGSAIVSKLYESRDAEATLAFVRDLAAAAHSVPSAALADD